MKIIPLLFIICFIAMSTTGQGYFKDQLKGADPAKEMNDISTADKLLIHQSYLEEAILKKDTLEQLYGLFYLYVDHYKLDDYVALQRVFLEANNLVEHTNEKTWKAAVAMRKAHLLELLDDDIEGALGQYKKAYEFCEEVKDSFCMAECLEQIAGFHKQLGHLEIASQQYIKALNLIKKFAGQAELALAYNNYSLFLSSQEKYNQAKIYLDSAIQIVHANNDLFKENMYKSNLASLYNKMDKPKAAIALYNQLIPINTTNQWQDHLLYNYAGIADAYEKAGMLEQTNTYTHYYYQLKDSIRGADVKLEIDKLKLDNEMSKKALLFEKNKVELQTVQMNNGRLKWLLIIGVLLALVSIYIWRNQIQKAKQEQQSNQDYLRDLSRLIQKKNILIRQQQTEIGQITAKVSETYASEDFNILDARITNDEDITAFKSYFEKAYPGFLLRVRKKWSQISNAEERLLMLIKLKLKSDEAAQILGISQSSIKKSRNRLRKRLEIDSNINLEDVVGRI